MPTYRDIRDEIRFRHGLDAAERYEREIERDGHSIYGEAWSASRAVDGCRDYDNERHAREAYDALDYEHRQKERRQEEGREAEEEQHRRQRAYEEEQSRQAEEDRQMEGARGGEE